MLHTVICGFYTEHFLRTVCFFRSTKGVFLTNCELPKHKQMANGAEP